MRALAAAVAGWCSLAVAQAPSHLESAALVGRVCQDLDGDGRCGSEEPGVPGARIALETGLTAIADAQGRYHLAALEARVPGVLGGVRLAPGRHRVGLDRRWLPPGTTATPSAVTVELSLGAVLVQDFALASRAASEPVVARLRGAELSSTRVSVLLAGSSLAGARIHVGSATAQAAGDGAWSLSVQVTPGPQTITVVEQRPDGLVRLEQRALELVTVGRGAMLVPLSNRSLGEVQLPALRGVGASASLQGSPGALVQLGGGEVRLDAGGRGALPVPGGPLTLRWHSPDAAPVEVTLDGDERAVVQALGLLDLELGLELGGAGVVPRLNGRGAGMLRARVKGFDLSADLDLRDQDLVALGSGKGLALLEPRALDVFQRALDAARDPPGYGDSSVTTASNPGGQRLRLELAREGLGFARVGNVRAAFEGSEVGRYHRAVSGGALELRTPDGWKGGVRARAFGWSSEQDLLSGLQHQPAHERFESTGGSLYWLSHGELVLGSEQVRVERRAAGTGLPLGEVHLERGKDYQLDAASGRLWLAAPLALFSGAALLGSDGLASAGEQVLVVDYEYLAPATADSAGGGAQLEGRYGPLTASAAAVREGRGFTLLRGQATAALGGYRVDAELAHSAGDARGLAWSDSGGLEAAQAPQEIGRDGWGVTARARGPGLFDKGFVDAAFRRRSAGYSDAQSAQLATFQQWSLRAEQPLGPMVLRVLLDDRVGPDPRTPFAPERLESRVLGGGAGYRAERWGVDLEARDAEFTAQGLTGGRTSMGVHAHLKALDWLTLRAGHRQRLVERGAGPGAWNDSLTSLGVEVSPADWWSVGAQAGYGPVLGPIAQALVRVQRGPERWYGAHAADVDAPALGETRTVSGVSTSVGPGSAVFVEDVAAHDVAGLRLSRAIGFTEQLSDALCVSARFERGVRSAALALPDLQRDAGGLSAGWTSRRLRLSARGELRRDASPTTAERLQWVAGGSAELVLRDGLTAGGFVQWSHAAQAGVLVSRNLAASASLAWRFADGAVIARYTARRELLPPQRGGVAETQLQVVSLLPTWKVLGRLSIGAGAHVGFAGAGPVFAASLRPSVRVIGGLEVAAEVARRSVAPDLGELTALRGELGWRFDDHFLVALGFTALGYSGLGLDSGGTGSANRAYLRLEAGY